MDWWWSWRGSADVILTPDLIRGKDLVPYLTFEDRGQILRSAQDDNHDCAASAFCNRSTVAPSFCASNTGLEQACALQA